MSRFRRVIDPERLSIGLVISAMDAHVMLRIFAGTQSGASGVSLEPFIRAIHVAFAAGVVASILGAAVLMMRGEHRSWEQSYEPVRVDR